MVISFPFVWSFRASFHFFLPVVRAKCRKEKAIVKEKTSVTKRFLLDKTLMMSCVLFCVFFLFVVGHSSGESSRKISSRLFLAFVFIFSRTRASRETARDQKCEEKEENKEETNRAAISLSSFFIFGPRVT